ncbi:MAG TPA: uracil-DNA glycosylase [Bryobacteraceae bacterium]|nr:uracil-DNA glycosylase [Bryobacteraceae bacterium]
MSSPEALDLLQQRVIECTCCPRLVLYRTRVAAEKRRAYRDQEYWGRPVPSFGDPSARLLVLGLAPGAHGANRTGRMFTGDSSGDFLFRAMHSAGFASQPQSTHRSDGLRLTDAYITASLRCAPPDNKPLPEEVRNCRPYLERELELLQEVEVVVALGRLAFDGYLRILRDRGLIASRSAFVFAHAAEHVTRPGLPLLISSYHPSQQNTSTGRLTPAMLEDVFQRARRRLHSIAPANS